MSSIRSINPMLRAVAVIGVVMSLVTAVTFAALSSSATLTNNTITSATSGLNVASGDVDATGNTAAGFAFTGLIPGGSASAPQQFNLKNTGEVPLDVSVAITDSDSPNLTSSDAVHFCFKQIDVTPSAESCYTRTQLLSNSLANVLPANPLPANDDNILYQVTVKLDQNAVNGSDAIDIAPFNFIFTGTGVTTPVNNE